MKKTLRYLIPILMLLGIFAAIAITLKRNKATAEERVYQYDSATDSTAKPMAATPTDAPDAPPAEAATMQWTGTFDPHKETKISADVQGKITRVMVDAGSTVTTGQPLVQLDDDLLQWQLKGVEVQIEGLEADVNRYTILAKADAVQGVQLEKAALGLKAARVQASTLRAQLDKTTIRAPFAGVVVAKLNEAGGFAAPGVPLIQLVDIGQLKFTINVPENDLRHFRQGTTYAITADALPDLSLSGKAVVVGSKANMANLFPIQFLVQNPDRTRLKAGMFGQVTIQ
jgi:membrane fusion protein (multidrug efflux system)